MSDNSNEIIVKIALVGDVMVGKTTLMVKYCKGIFSENYVLTLGVQFLERKISVKNTPVNLVIWDIGGDKTFLDMMPVTCDGAHAIVFIFDLANLSTLSRLKEWYKAASECNAQARVFLVGNKFDLYHSFTPEQKIEITKKAKKFAEAIDAPLVYCSSKHSINVKRLFQIIISQVFGLELNINTCEDPEKPIIMY